MKIPAHSLTASFFSFKKSEMIVEIRMTCKWMATPRCSKEGIMFDYFLDMPDGS
jgi:hypothetical protein